MTRPTQFPSVPEAADENVIDRSAHTSHPSWTRPMDLAVAAVIACATGCLTFWSTFKGMSLTPDSAQYLSVAENLAAGNGFTLWNTNELKAFPPGYPILIRLGMVFGWTSDTSARMIGVASSALIVFGTGYLAAMLSRRHIATPVALITAFFPYVVYLSTWIYAEPVFTVALLITAIGLITFVRGACHPRRALLVMILGTWACCLLRYYGYAVIIGCVVALVFSQGVWRSRLRCASAYFAGSVIAPIGIIAHNMWRSESVGRPGFGPRDDLWSNIVDSVRAVGRWTGVRANWASWLGDGQLGIVLLLFGAGLVGTALIRSSRDREAAGMRAVLMLIVSIVLMTWVSARLVWVSVDQRVLFPVLPLSIALVSTAVVTLAHMGTRYRRVALSAAFAIACLLFAPGLSQASHFAHEYPQGFGSSEWRQSTLISTIQSLPQQTVVYANDPAAVWVRTRRDGIRSLNELLRGSGESESAYAQRLNRFSCSMPFVVWFDRSSRMERGVLDIVEHHVLFRRYESTEGTFGFMFPVIESSCDS